MSYTIGQFINVLFRRQIDMFLFQTGDVLVKITKKKDRKRGLSNKE